MCGAEKQSQWVRAHERVVRRRKSQWTTDFSQKSGRRTRHAGHCWRSRDELIRDVLLWIPTHGRAKAGWPARTYIQQLCEDTGCCPEDLPRAMNDREEWRERVRDIRAASTIWWWWWYSLQLSSDLQQFLFFIGYVYAHVSLLYFPLVTVHVHVLLVPHWLLALAHFYGRTNLPPVAVFNHVHRSRWYSDNHLIDIIVNRMKLSTTSADTRTPAGHGDIPVITPILLIYLSTTSAMFKPAGHVNILPKPSFKNNSINEWFNNRIIHKIFPYIR